MQTPQQMNTLFRDAWRVMTSRMPDNIQSDAAGLSTCFGNVPLFFFNLSIYDAPIADLASLEQTLASAKQSAATFPHGWFHVLSPDLAPTGWEAAAAAQGFAPAMNLTGMHAPKLTPPTRPLPTLDIRPVQDDRTYRDMAEVNMKAYGMPPEVAECIANGHLWQADSYGAVAYLDDQPVAATAAFPVSGTIYIALVASDAAHRGKGFAEATFRHVVAEAEKLMGQLPLTLHATEAGARLYQSIGFEHCGQFTLLVPGGGH